VTWSLPSDNKYKPDGFRLYYRKTNSEKSGPIDLTANSTQYLLGNLGKQVHWHRIGCYCSSVAKDL